MYDALGNCKQHVVATMNCIFSPPTLVCLLFSQRGYLRVLTFCMVSKVIKIQGFHPAKHVRQPSYALHYDRERVIILSGNVDNLKQNKNHKKKLYRGKNPIKNIWSVGLPLSSFADFSFYWFCLIYPLCTYWYCWTYPYHTCCCTYPSLAFQWQQHFITTT